MSEGCDMLTSPSLSTGLAAVQPVPRDKTAATLLINTRKSVLINCGSNRTVVVQFVIIPVPYDGTGVVDFTTKLIDRKRVSSLARFEPFHIDQSLTNVDITLRSADSCNSSANLLLRLTTRVFVGGGR